jgi:hypothetical protein
MGTTLIIFGLVLSVIIIVLIFSKKLEEPFLIFIATMSAWFFIVLGIVSQTEEKSYQQGQKDALREKQMYDMRIFYERLKDDTYYPVDTLFEEKRYHHKNKL